MNPPRVCRRLLCSALLAAPTFAWAGPVVEFKQTQPVVREVPLDIFRAEVTQTFQSDFQRGHGYKPDEKSNNNTNTWHYELELAHRMRLEGNWYLKLGVSASRYDFGNNRSLAPNTLNGYAGVIALEYFTDDGERAFFVESKPGVYFAHELKTQDFDVPTNIALAYPIMPGKVFLIGGVTVGILREYPVLPIGGVLWHINDKWDLRAYLPDPKLVYKISDKVEVWGGGEFVGGAFMNDSRTDQRALALNNTPVEYYEIRGGFGMRVAAWNHVNIDFAGGWAFVRKFDFYRADITQSTNGAPYLRLEGTYEF